MPDLVHRVSTTAVLIVPHICFRTYPLSSSLSHISFVVPIVLPLHHISAPAVSVASRLLGRIRCHPCPLYLSSRMSASAVLINLILPYIFHLTLSASSRISASAILVILHLFRIYAVAVSAAAVSILMRPCRPIPSIYFQPYLKSF